MLQLGSVLAAALFTHGKSSLSPDCDISEAHGKRRIRRIDEAKATGQESKLTGPTRIDIDD